MLHLAPILVRYSSHNSGLEKYFEIRANARKKYLKVLLINTVSRVYFGHGF
jgi:hypothetical protein